MAQINPCSCGAAAEYIKNFESNWYSVPGFVRCTKCAKEGRPCISKQNAIRNWNKLNPLPDGPQIK